MKPRMIVSTFVVVSLALSAALAPVARASKLRTYRGETSQRRPGPVYFLIVRTADGLRVRDFDFEFRLRCEDGSRLAYGTGYGFGRPGYPLDDHQLDFRNGGLRLTGTFAPGLAHGTARFRIRRLPGGDRMLCTTGNIAWAARRVTA